MNPRPETENAGIAERLFRLIDAAYPSDAAFERACGLPAKTVSNWRRGRSETYLKQLPALAQALGVSCQALIADTADGESTAEGRLWHALSLSRSLPDDKRQALLDTLVSVIRLAVGEVTP